MLPQLESSVKGKLLKLYTWEGALILWKIQLVRSFNKEKKRQHRRKVVSCRRMRIIIILLQATL